MMRRVVGFFFLLLFSLCAVVFVFVYYYLLFTSHNGWTHPSKVDERQSSPWMSQNGGKSNNNFHPLNPLQVIFPNNDPAWMIDDHRRDEKPSSLIPARIAYSVVTSSFLQQLGLRRRMEEDDGEQDQQQQQSPTVRRREQEKQIIRRKTKQSPFRPIRVISSSILMQPKSEQNLAKVQQDDHGEKKYNDNNNELGKHISLSQLERKTNETVNRDIQSFKRKLINELRRRVSESVNPVTHPGIEEYNPYNVRSFSRSEKIHFPSRDRLCSLPFQVMDATFPGIISTGVFPILPLTSFERIFQTRVLDRLQHTGRTKPTCALVSSSGGLLNSSSGSDIDSHDVVIRFNDAPAGGVYASDVGSKTTIRIINSKVATSSSFESILQKDNDSILLSWDPFQYMTEDSVTLRRLYDDNEIHMDYPALYATYIKVREDFPDRPFYLLHPMTIWNLFEELEKTTAHTIPRSPPSSGFLGLFLLLKYCSQVAAFDLVPSIRLTPRCHFYDNFSSPSFSCTLGGKWSHPLPSEKLYALSMNYASDYDLVVRGKASFMGCP